MSRFSRINTIWRKELIDTLRDRRTLVAMILVPMVIYPALMLGSLQAFEVQVSGLVTEEYQVAVESQDAKNWLVGVLEGDEKLRQHAGQGTADDAEETALAEETAESQPAVAHGGTQAAVSGVYNEPPKYSVWVVRNAAEAVANGAYHAAVLFKGDEFATDFGSLPVLIAFDESDIRSEIAATGLHGILGRKSAQVLAARLHAHSLAPDFVEPIKIAQWNVAPQERMTGAVLGQIVPLILVLMTMIGAIYPAIDLTAGERERGTLETLMVAPVPTVDLIAGKFVVVTLIGMLSAVLNLLSVGGTVYLSGVGTMLAPGAELSIPLSALPWILLLLLPLAIMFSAMLLAVCSFARSFKEAQNYIVPVMLAAMIPGVVGMLPGTRLAGPILIMPVANIVVLARELFMGRFDAVAILIVALSTCLYAGAAVAIAAKLFGQEAVLFADAGSVRTLFQRKRFKVRAVPSAAHALLVITVAYSLNFYIQQGIMSGGALSGMPYLGAVALTIALVFAVGPWIATRYMRTNPTTTFRLGAPDPRGIVAALCFGCSTWILALFWNGIQQKFLPMDSTVARMLEQQFAWMNEVEPWRLIFFLALVPALCEELFFRGYALSGLRGTLGKAGAVVVVAIAFGMTHYSAQRMVVTTALGMLLGMLVVQYGSIWPAMIAHFMHNAISVLAVHPAGLKPWLFAHLGFTAESLPLNWVWGAAALASLGVVICLFFPKRERNEIPGGESVGDAPVPAQSPN